jgi:hypothetical protein
MPNRGTCVDYGIGDTPGQNDICKSETKQRTKTKAMQQSVFPRPVRLVVIQEPFVEISQQCHESHAVKYAKTQENKRESARVTVETEPRTRHKNQRCRGKSHHDLGYFQVALVAMLKGHRFAMRVERSECRRKAVPYFEGIYSDTPPNKGENSQASYQREYDCFHCPMLYRADRLAVEDMLSAIACLQEVRHRLGDRG